MGSPRIVSPVLHAKSTDLQGKRENSGDGGNRTHATFPPSPLASGEHAQWIAHLVKGAALAALADAPFAEFAARINRAMLELGRAFQPTVEAAARAIERFGAAWTKGPTA